MTSIFPSRVRLLLLLLVLMFVGLFVPMQQASAQGASKASATPAQQRDVAQQINSVIDKLADKLSVPAVHLYGVLVRQGQAQALSNLVTVIFWVGATVLLWTVILPKLIDKNNDEDVIIGTTIGSIISLIFCGIALYFATDLVAYAWNPEFYAVNRIIEVLK